jgi:protein-tyrosine phosphatase
MTTPASILFVCLGNICRSPTGEGVLRHLVEERGLDSKVTIDSAGTIGYHEGNPADRRMRDHASKRGYDLTSRSRKIVADDLDRFDLVIAMDRQNLSDIMEIDPAATNVKLMSDFLDDSWPVDVPDPYYGGADGFETVLDMIEAACPNILDELLR